MGVAETELMVKMILSLDVCDLRPIRKLVILSP